MAWEPLPHWHVRGNFWLAKCSYVRSLIPPTDFDEKRADMFRQLLYRGHRNKSWACLRSYFNESKEDIYEQSQEIQSLVGVGRYNNEAWITSHPDVIPCDVTNTAFTSKPTNQKKFNQPYAQHEWFRMHGRLYEFYHLYHKLPSNTSFFWKYYATLQEPTKPKWCQKGWNRSSYYHQIP
jgi:hypothetical protein